MKQRPFGTTGWQVGAIGLGGMPMSVKADRPDEDESIAVIHHAIDCGVTLIDTADSYCLDDTEPGHNERLIGKALALFSASARQDVYVATKGGLVRPEGRWERCARPEHLRTVCEQSLANLQTDVVDIYQLHAPDPQVPVADSIGELKRLQEEGKIRHVAVSNFSVDELELALSIVPIVSIQNQYSPKCRRPEQDGTLASSEKLGVAFLPWSPLNGMSGAKQLGGSGNKLCDIAADHGVSVQQIVLAWHLSKGPHVIPIPGASHKESIEDSAKADQVSLSSEEIAALDQLWQ